jgi:hypothetical protein
MMTLTVRAQRILADLGVSTPQELHRLKLPPWEVSLDRYILRTPNCGRKTLREIMEWGESGRGKHEPEKPPAVYIRWVLESGAWKMAGYAVEPIAGDAWIRYDATPQEPPDA